MSCTCFLIGHHDAPGSLLPMLIETVERHVVDYGVTVFTVGHYGAFDRLAATAVKTAKQRRPEISLSLLLPYHPFDRPIEVPDGFDSTFYPPGMETVPRRAAILRANRYMIEHSDYLITYARSQSGNTGNLLALAVRWERKGMLHIENLFKP